MRNIHRARRGPGRTSCGEIEPLAIEFGRTQIVGRSRGQTAIRAAAYRAGERLFDARTGLVADYAHRAAEVRHTEVLLPDGADASLADRRTLWEAVEAREDRHSRRATAQLARDHIVALPRELDPDDQVALARAFAREEFVSKGLVVDLAVHDHSEGNPHAHLMTTTRALDGHDFGAKARAENGAFARGAKLADDEQLRHRWAAFQNRWLREKGLEERVHVHDGERYRAEVHLGPARGMERRAIRTQRGVLNDAIVSARTRTLLEHPEIVIDRVADRSSLFTRRALYREAHKLVTEPEAFAHLKARIDAHPSLVPLGDPDEADEVLTTHGTLRLECRVRAIGAELGRPVAGSDPSGASVETALDDALARRPHLSDEQRDAARHVSGDERLALVVGLAGAGKSSMLAAVREAHEAVGRSVHGLALAGRAADELARSAGIESSTIAAWQLALASGRAAIEPGAVYVIDEAGMVGNRQMLAVLEAIERGGAKAVLVGDAEQLQAIRAGCPFRDLARQEGAAEIGTIRRQRIPWQREATARLARGDAAGAVAAYAREGFVHEGERAAVVDRLVADYLGAGAASKAILAHRRADVEALNDAVRAARRAAGELGAGLPFHRGDPPDVPDRPPIDLEIGSRVRFATSDPALGLVAGDVGTWLGEKGGVQAVRTDDGRRVDFRPDEYDGVRHVHATASGTLDIAVGDRVLFARNDTRLGVRNGLLGEVVRFDGAAGAGTVATVRTDDGRTIDVDDRAYPHLEHGYATTVHKAQGMTVDRAFVLGQGSMDRHVGYVAMSRHRDRLDVYLPDDEFAERSFVEAVSRARRQESALDLARERGLEAEAGERGTGSVDAPAAPDDGSSAARAEDLARVSPARSGPPSRETPTLAEGKASGHADSMSEPVRERGGTTGTGGRSGETTAIGHDPRPPRDVVASEDGADSASAFAAAERRIADATTVHLAELERAHAATLARARETLDTVHRALQVHAGEEPRTGWFAPAARHAAWSERGEALARDARRARAALDRVDGGEHGRRGRETRARELASAACPEAVRTLARRDAIASGQRAHRSLDALERLRDDPSVPAAGVERDIARTLETIRGNAAYLASLDGPARERLAVAGERSRTALERAASRGLER